MDSLLATVAQHADEVGLPHAVLVDSYNEKQFEYSQFKALLPEKDQPLKGTLCWEFGKQIVFHYANLHATTGIDIGLIGLAAADYAIALIKVLSDRDVGVGAWAAA